MRTFIHLATAVIALPLAAGAQPLTLGPTPHRAIIDKAADLVAADYVLPDKAKPVARTLAANAVAGKYAALAKPDDFLAAVNADMQSAGGDRHLRIVANPRITFPTAGLHVLTFHYVKGNNWMYFEFEKAPAR